MSGSKLLDDSSIRDAPDAAPVFKAPFWERLLGLTVRSVPTLEQATNPLVQTRRGRWQMLVLLLICAAPVVASYFAYYVVRPEGRRNFGALVEPQRPLPNLRGVALNGEVNNLKELRGQWLLLSVAAGACDELCSRNLYLQRQLRESLGKEKDRVDWVWLIPDAAPVPDRLLPALKGATVLRVSSAGLFAWLSPANGHQLSEHLYVVDPMGNWMMRFPANLDLSSSAHALRDLERLLRASASWDAPGR